MKQSGYIKRLQARKAEEIGNHREQAVMVAMSFAMVSLLDRGWGYDRLVLLANEVTKNIVEYYKADAQEQEVEMAHVRRRLEQVGLEFSSDGRIVAALDENGKPVKPAEADRRKAEAMAHGKA